MRAIPAAYVATAVATALLVGLTGVGVRERHLAAVLPTTTLQAQFPGPGEGPAPNSCEYDFRQRASDIEKELQACNRWCYADEYASCQTACLEDRNIAMDDARADQRECLRARR